MTAAVGFVMRKLAATRQDQVEIAAKMRAKLAAVMENAAAVTARRTEHVSKSKLADRYGLNHFYQSLNGSNREHAL